MRSGTIAIILTIATVTALTGCVTQEPTTGSTTATPTASASPTNHEDPHDAGVVTPAPEADTQSQASAIQAATTVLQRFARPGLDYDLWWAELLPLLSQQAGTAYEGTIPAEVPVHQVTGAGTMLEGSTDVSLIVQLPTDAGPYNVTLTRSDATAVWLADRIRPAQG